MSPSKSSSANVAPSQDNLVSTGSGKKSMPAEEIKPSSPRIDVRADETANAEPDEIFRPSSEGKGISFKQTTETIHFQCVQIFFYLSPIMDSFFSHSALLKGLQNPQRLAVLRNVSKPISNFLWFKLSSKSWLLEFSGL